MALFIKIDTLVSSLSVQSITEDRKRILDSLIYFIQQKIDENKPIRIHFICTHNSRRSHLAQVWAQTMVHYFRLQNVYCYSGGTEATALFPMVAETLKNSGFKIQILSKGENPVYSIKYAENEPPIIGFSKKIDDEFNPKSEFAAVLTCAQADANCPFVAGAEKRIPLPFEDPKEFDNTSLQTEKYNERSLQIATELLYVFSQIQSKNDRH